MKRQDKLDIVTKLLREGGGKFTAAELLAAAGTHRRARSALFLSRKVGVVLEAVRDGGHTVVSYVCMNYNKEPEAVAPQEQASTETEEPKSEETPPVSGWKTREEYSA